MVEERAAEGGLEEVVRNCVMRMVFLMQVLVDGERLSVVVALRQADGVASGRIPILVPVIELVLLLVEAVHDIFSAATGQVGRAGCQAMRREDPGLRAGAGVLGDVGFDREGRIRAMACEGCCRCGIRAIGSQWAWR